MAEQREIKKEMLKRDSLLRLAVRTNVTSNWEAYKIARYHVTGIIRDAKSNYYRHVINQNSNNSSKLWKTLKTVLPKKSSCTPSSIVYNDNVLTSNKDIPNSFNMHFTNFAKELIE